MSRRYGRNQKRRARLEIERLERQVSGWGEAYSRDVPMLRNENTRLRRLFADVRDALGPNFVGLAPEEVVRRTWELAAPDDFRKNVGGGIVTMRTMAYESFDRSDAPQHQLHFRVQLAGHRVGYALSEPALRHTPARFLAMNIAHELAELLVASLRKAGAHE